MGTGSHRGFFTVPSSSLGMHLESSGEWLKGLDPRTHMGHPDGAQGVSLAQHQPRHSLLSLTRHCSPPQVQICHFHSIMFCLDLWLFNKQQQNISTAYCFT